MISPKRWMMLLGLLIVGGALLIVLFRPEPSLEHVGVPMTTATTNSVNHPPMNPLKVEADDPSSLEAALEKNPGHSPILMRMAELARKQGDLGKAVEHLRQAIDAEPGNLDARLELGRALFETGDAKGALRETNEIIERDPNHVDALYNLGAIHANEKRPDLAVNYWSRAVASDSTSESGRNAQRGLDILSGRVQANSQENSSSIPDIPEHRNVRRPTASVDPKKALIEFAAQQ